MCWGPRGCCRGACASPQLDRRVSISPRLSPELPRDRSANAEVDVLEGRCRSVGSTACCQAPLRLSYRTDSPVTQIERVKQKVNRAESENGRFAGCPALLLVYFLSPNLFLTLRRARKSALNAPRRRPVRIANCGRVRLTSSQHYPLESGEEEVSVHAPEYYIRRLRDGA